MEPQDPFDLTGKTASGTGGSALRVSHFEPVC